LFGDIEHRGASAIRKLSGSSVDQCRSRRPKVCVKRRLGLVRDDDRANPLCNAVVEYAHDLDAVYNVVYRVRSVGESALGSEHAVQQVGESFFKGDASTTTYHALAALHRYFAALAALASVMDEQCWITD
jgi:hypothetical protein